MVRIPSRNEALALSTGLAMASGFIGTSLVRTEAQAGEINSNAPDIWQRINEVRDEATNNNPGMILTGPDQDSLRFGVELAAQNTYLDALRKVRIQRTPKALDVDLVKVNFMSTMQVAHFAPKPDSGQTSEKVIGLAIDGDALMLKDSEISVDVKPLSARRNSIVPGSAKKILPQQQDLSPDVVAPKFENVYTRTSSTYTLHTNIPMNTLARRAMKSGRVRINIDESCDLRDEYVGKIKNPCTRIVHYLVKVRPNQAVTTVDLTRSSSAANVQIVSENK